MLMALLAQAGTSFWMPEKASTIAPDVDGLFGFVYWLCIFFFSLVTVLLVLFVVRYRHRPGETRESAAGHSTALELTWTIIPTILVLVIFYYGFRGYLNMSVEPPNPYEITVTGQMWSWSFRYPNGYEDNELHIPVNTPVRLVLSSKDVIHSLYMPVFRIKKDVVPGRYNRFWVEATQLSPKEGFDIYCAEYCGVNHSQMLARLHVHTPDDFEAWLKKASDIHGRLNPIDAGRELYMKRGCTQCHSVEKGVVIQAPSFRDLFGSNVPTDKGTVLADENYIRESILYPQAKLHAGFGPVMPSFLGQLSDMDIDAIIAYFKSISVNFKGDLTPYKQIRGKGATTAPATGPVAATPKSPSAATQPAHGQASAATTTRPSPVTRRTPGPDKSK